MIYSNSIFLSLSLISLINHSSSAEKYTEKFEPLNEVKYVFYKATFDPAESLPLTKELEDDLRNPASNDDLIDEN